MITSVEGTFRDGRVELDEIPPNVKEARVIITFLPEPTSGRRGPNLSAREAADLRARLTAWEDDWNAPGMEAYDEL